MYGSPYRYYKDSIKESGHIKLSDTNVYWGVWDDAYSKSNRADYDNLNFITEVRETSNTDLKLPTTGTIEYSPIAKSKVTNANGTTPGTLDSADLAINFATNKADAAYKITYNNATKTHLDSLVLTSTESLTGKLDGSFSEGVMMGNEGSHAGLVYNIANHNGVRARGSVLFEKTDKNTKSGLKMNRLAIQAVPVNTTNGIVATISTTDQAAGSSLTYTLVSGGDSRFAINSSTGQIYLTGTKGGNGLHPIPINSTSTYTSLTSNYYDLEVKVTDGTNTDIRHVYVKQANVGTDTAYVANTVLTTSAAANGTLYLNNNSYDPKLDAGVGVTSFGATYAPGMYGSPYRYYKDSIKESGHIKLSDTNVYWGVWDDAYSKSNRADYDNLNFITEVRETSNTDLKLPTTGTIEYSPIAKSKVTNANGTTPGTLDSADLAINFATNKADAAYKITYNNATKTHLDSLVLTSTGSLTGKLDGSFSEGVMMGNEGSHAGLVYNIANHNGVRARGSVLFGPKAAKGLVSDRVGGKNNLSIAEAGLVIDSDKVSSLLRLPNGDNSQVVKTEKSVDSSNTSTITEFGKKDLTDNTVYWGRWSKLMENAPGASATLDDNPQLFMFESNPDDNLELPTSGTWKYDDIASTSVYDEQGNSGSLTDANMSINFGTNAVTSQYQINMGSGANWSNDITATLTPSTGNFAPSSVASSFANGDGHMAGTLMGDNGSHAAAVYNVQLGTNASSNMATGAVLFQKQ
jgi:glutamine cyclotransferase